MIANLESEVESRKELCSRLTKQLRSVASVAGKRGDYSGLWQSQQGTEAVLSAWLRNAQKKYREDRGNRIASSLYSSKLCGRTYHSWHLLTVTEHMGRVHSEEIRLKEDSIHRMALERDRAREEVKRLISELDFERGKRADFISKIKSTFSNKLDTLLTDN